MDRNIHSLPLLSPLPFLSFFNFLPRSQGRGRLYIIPIFNLFFIVHSIFSSPISKPFQDCFGQKYERFLRIFSLSFLSHFRFSLFIPTCINPLSGHSPQNEMKPRATSCSSPTYINWEQLFRVSERNLSNLPILEPITCKTHAAASSYNCMRFML